MKLAQTGGMVLSLLAGLALIAGGCNQADTAGRADKKQAAAQRGASDDSATWWCMEHGVPEDICGQCKAEVAAECKKKGDWCKEHDRPDSQCFICHPELKEKFAAQYRAKYGKEPPPTEDDEKKDESKKGEK